MVELRSNLPASGPDLVKLKLSPSASVAFTGKLAEALFSATVKVALPAKTGAWLGGTKVKMTTLP